MSQHLQNIFVDVIGFTVMTPMLDTVAKQQNSAFLLSISHCRWASSDCGKAWHI